MCFWLWLPLPTKRHQRQEEDEEEDYEEEEIEDDEGEEELKSSYSFDEEPPKKWYNNRAIDRHKVNMKFFDMLLCYHQAKLLKWRVVKK